MKLSFRLLLSGLLCLAAATLAADRPNFSGSYTLTGGKGSLKFEKGIVHTLDVMQTETSIKVNEVKGGRSNVNSYPLDGQEGYYISPGGLTGTCKGQFKQKYLLLESTIASRPKTNGPAVQIHTKQKWELSPDLKTLRIHIDVDSPQSPINIIEPWTEIYTRN